MRFFAGRLGVSEEAYERIVGDVRRELSDT